MLSAPDVPCIAVLSAILGIAHVSRSSFTRKSKRYCHLTSALLFPKSYFNDMHKASIHAMNGSYNILSNPPILKIHQ